MGTLVAYAMLPLVAMLLATAIAVIRPTGPRLRSAIMHLGAGVVFAVVALELLPPVIHSDSIVTVVIGFCAGAALMLGLRKLNDHEGEAPGDAAAASGRSTTGMLVAIGIDLLVDGVMLGLGFAAGERAGVLLALALTLESAALGLAVTTALRERQSATKRIFAVVCGLGGALLVGAAIGTVTVSYAPAGALPSLLAFGSAALLFLVTEELLEEAHEVKETPALTGMFFLGFLALMVLEMAGAAH